MAGKKKSPAPKRHRSAESGRFVTERTAKRHPKTTVSETVKKGKKK